MLNVIVSRYFSVNFLHSENFRELPSIFINMCGICVLLTKSSSSNIQLRPECLSSLSNRGPDHCQTGTVHNGHNSIHYISTVLHMRSPNTVTQPISAQNGNGNLLFFNGEIYDGLDSMTEQDNDGELILSKLEQCESVTELQSTVQSLKGEFCFVYYEHASQVLWLVKDPLGHKSLLVCRNENENSICISSLQVEFESEEGATSNSANNGDWRELPPGFLWQLSLIDFGLIAHRLTGDYTNSVCEPLSDIVPIGNVDCTYPCLFHIRPFSSASQYSEAQMNETIELVLGSLQTAVTRRLAGYHSNQSSCQPHIAVLFSGGLDSTILAAILHRVAPKEVVIDLVTVAFAKDDADESAFAATADRQTALAAYYVLKDGAPDRHWQLVCANVSLSELQLHRQQSIRGLLAPLSSVLDDSIGCALWFAARGRGVLQDTEQEYCSPARVMLMGLGADELFAGYSRHRGKFESGGWDALHREMVMDQSRLWSRDLARDDRVLSDHHREARFPFLDTDFVKLVNDLPLDVKCDLSQPRGLGEKSLLRAVAVRLALEKVAYYPKRAIQFGSRIAKIESRKEKGGDQCDRLKMN